MAQPICVISSNFRAIWTVKVGHTIRQTDRQTDTRPMLYAYSYGSSRGSMLGLGGHRPPNLAQASQINTAQSDTVVLLLVDVIGSIVISLSRCCLPNDEGPAPPQYFFLEPPLYGSGQCDNYSTWSVVGQLVVSCISDFVCVSVCLSIYSVSAL